MASIVVPACSLTINLSSSIMLLIKVDLPAFGLPRIATLFPEWSIILLSGILLFKIVLNSSMFNECSELISIKSLIPYLLKSSFIDVKDFLSDLFKTQITSLSYFLSLEIIFISSLLSSSEPSKTWIIIVESSTAIHACLDIESFNFSFFRFSSIPPVSIINDFLFRKFIKP